MWNFVKSVFTFRLAQSTSKRMAYAVGLGRLATLAGLVGGVMAVRRRAH